MAQLLELLHNSEPIIMIFGILYLVFGRIIEARENTSKIKDLENALTSLKDTVTSLDKSLGLLAQRVDLQVTGK